MRRESHVRFCEGAGVRFPRATRLLILCKSPAQAAEALELTDYLLAELELRLHPEKTRMTSFDQGFKFLGAIFLGESVFLPFDKPARQRAEPRLAPPLDLQTYLELRHVE